MLNGFSVLLEVRILDWAGILQVGPHSKSDRVSGAIVYQYVHGRTNGTILPLIFPLDTTYRRHHQCQSEKKGHWSLRDSRYNK